MRRLAEPDGIGGASVTTSSSYPEGGLRGREAFGAAGHMKGSTPTAAGNKNAHTAKLP